MSLAWLAGLPRWLRDGLPLAAWLALIFYLSAQPALIEIESESGEKLFFKSAHVFFYAVLTWLWWRTLTPGRQATWPGLLMAVTLTILYAISDEIHQGYVPGRYGRVADVLFDASGALLMVLCLRLLAPLRTFPERVPVPFGPRGGESSPKFFKVKH